MTLNPKNLTLAQNFFEKKVRIPHYDIRYINDIAPMDGWCTFESFSDENMAKLIALREKYGENDFFNHLNEIFDEETLEEMVPGDIISFDLDTPCYLYRFTCHHITDSGVRTETLKIHLYDHTYVRLLAHHLEDRHMNINRLRYADKELYDIVTRGVDSCFLNDDFYCAFHPYVITMDEVKEDAAKIEAENPESFKHLDSCLYPF